MAVASGYYSGEERAFIDTSCGDAFMGDTHLFVDEGHAEDFLPTSTVNDHTLNMAVQKNIDTCSHDMFVKILYRGRPVATRRVLGRAGCRIFFGSPRAAAHFSTEEQKQLFGQRHLLQLCLPRPTEALSHLQPLWHLLNCLSRGILLEIEDDIYATRLCHAVVFWGSPGNDGMSCELEKGRRTKIFNYKAFLDIHRAFSNPELTSMAAEPPPYEVLLGVGQPWGPLQKSNNNLLMISVTHCRAEMMMAELHRQRWDQRCYLDTDWVWFSKMTAEDKKAFQMKQAMLPNPSSGSAAAVTSSTTAYNEDREEEDSSGAKQP